MEKPEVVKIYLRYMIILPDGMQRGGLIPSTRWKLNRADMPLLV